METKAPAAWIGMRAHRRECRCGLPGYPVSSLQIKSQQEIGKIADIYEREKEYDKKATAKALARDVC